MPYIDQEDREYILQANTPGALNFLIHEEIDRFLPGEASYDDYNAVLGVLEAVKQEFYRRRVAPYEDKKLEENGDITLYSD